MGKDCLDVVIQLCDQLDCKCEECEVNHHTGECVLCPKYGCPEHPAEVEIEVQADGGHDKV